MNWKCFLFAAAMLIITLLFVVKIAMRGEPVVRRINLEHLPMELSGYLGEEDSFSQEVYDTLQADFNLYRHYRKPKEELSLYIGYYGTAKGGRTGHDPYACLPGAGWGIVEQGTVLIRTRNQPEGARVNYVVAQKGEIYNVILHWYQSGTKVLATGLQQNFERFKRRLLHNKNDGAYIQISSLTREHDVVAVKASLCNFSITLQGILPKYWPDEG